MVNSLAGICQDEVIQDPNPKTGHEIELLGGYSYVFTGYDPGFLETVNLDFNQNVINYGIGYTYRWKRLRHQFYLSSFSTNYNFDRRVGDSGGWTEHEGSVTQQWLEVGGFGGFKLFDSLNVRLYPCFGFSYALPVSGSVEGVESDGEFSTANQVVNYELDKAPSNLFNIKFGLMYNWEFKPNFGVNTYVFYNRSLVHPDLLGNDESLGKIQLNQVNFNLGIYYFIERK